MGRGKKGKDGPVLVPAFGPAVKADLAAKAIVALTQRQEALILLDVTEEQVDACPKIEHLFKGIGGKDRVLEFLAGSEEPDARSLLEQAKKLTTHQLVAVPFEALCLAAGLTTKRAFGLVAEEATTQSAAAATLVAKAARADVVKATVDSALTPFGVKDREMLHKAEGFVPVPKTQTTFVRGDQVVDARVQTVNAILPPLEEGIRRSSDRFNEIIKQRVAALPEPEAIEVEEEEDEE
jgi:hypothetical protein